MEVFLIFVALSFLGRLGLFLFDRSEDNRKRARILAEDRATLSRGMARHHYGD